MVLWYMGQEGVEQYCHSPRLSNEYIAWPAIKELCGEVSKKRILDLGTAGGETARKLATKGASCLGIDISNEMLQIARETTNKDGLKIEYLERDCNNLWGVPDNEFDITILNFLLCNVSSVNQINSIFQEAYRVTKLKGSAIFTMHHPLQLVLKETSLQNGVVANDGPSHYFASGERVKRFLKTYNGVAIVDNFHWTIDDYISSFVMAGFLVDAIKEPKPVSPPSEFAEYFKQAYFTPLYFVVRGIKK